MKQLRIVLLTILLFSTLLGVSTMGASAQDIQPIVHTVLFYSPTCAHCEYVITQVLPPLRQKYGTQLQIIGFDVSHPAGEAMFDSALDRFGLQQPSVPLLVIDNITLVGSEEISEQYPKLVEGYLGLGGIGWPDIPGLRETLLTAAQTATAEDAGRSSAEAPATVADPESLALEQMPWQQRLGGDLTAYAIAVAIVVAMLASGAWAYVRSRRLAGRAGTSSSGGALSPAGRRAPTSRPTKRSSKTASARRR